MAILGSHSDLGYLPRGSTGDTLNNRNSGDYLDRNTPSADLPLIRLYARNIIQRDAVSQTKLTVADLAVLNP